MAPSLSCLTFIILTFNYVSSYKYQNITLDPAARQIYDFKKHHPEPIGVLTTSQGSPVEIRDTNAINSDLLSNRYYLDSAFHLDRERIPERMVHAKGGGAFGYFEVTHDVSKYTKADIFNGIGKKTPLVIRFSPVSQNLGGSDIARESKGFALKFYTKEGNFDILGLHIPVFFFRDPSLFPSFVHSIKRNPRTNLFDPTTQWDFLTKRPTAMHSHLWLSSDYGLPNGYRKLDGFGVHTYLITNRHGKKYYVKFNFRTEQGIENLPSDEARRIASRDPDYYNRDLYNAIENKNYPSWQLEMYVMSSKDIKNLDYSPFDITRQWKNATYHTVPIGRMVLNRNPENFFKDIEQVAFNPINLVPGIPGPQDHLFRGRHFLYRDAENYRLGVNHDKIEVNCPLYAKTYLRDGDAPVKDNMKDVPNYYLNSFNGPVPYVDESRPAERLVVYENSANDLQPVADFYNYYVADEGHRRRLSETVAESLARVKEPVLKNTLNILTAIDSDLGHRVKEALPAARITLARESRVQKVIVNNLRI